jgi:DNA-binding MarR family transcriptional regulator
VANIFEGLAGLDRLIHEPARLSILTALSVCTYADFLSLQRLTGLTVGNLSSHLSKLEEASLVRVDKRFVNKRPNTQVQITDSGRKAVERHWKQLDSLRKNSRSWKPDS